MENDGNCQEPANRKIRFRRFRREGTNENQTGYREINDVLCMGCLLVFWLPQFAGLIFLL